MKDCFKIVLRDSLTGLAQVSKPIITYTWRVIDRKKATNEKRETSVTITGSYGANLAQHSVRNVV